MSRVHRLRGPNGQRVILVAGITGLASDAELVRVELERAAPAKVLLGVPYEDLDAIRATSGKEQEAEFEAAAVDEAYLERLKKFGPVQSPPPDLYLAYRYAESKSIPVEAIDLADEAYSEAYAKHVGFFEVLRSNRTQRRVTSEQFDSSDADAFVREWDDALNRTKGLRKLQRAREQTMMQSITKTAAGAVVVALVPLSRAQGVVDLLAENGWTA